MHIDGKASKKKHTEKRKTDQDYLDFLANTPEGHRDEAKGVGTIAKLSKRVARMEFIVRLLIEELQGK